MLIRLIPRHPIFMQSFGYADEHRFALLFREAWAEIPLGGHRAILKYWRALPFPARIEVLNVWGDFYGRRDIMGTIGVPLGQCDFFFNALTRIRFWAPFVDNGPVEIVKLVIQHELAHVAAFGYKYHSSDEEVAGDIMAMWGLDEEARIDWDCEKREEWLSQVGLTLKELEVEE